jgi:hypothetical protein
MVFFGRYRGGDVGVGVFSGSRVFWFKIWRVVVYCRAALVCRRKCHWVFAQGAPAIVCAQALAGWLAGVRRDSNKA